MRQKVRLIVTRCSAIALLCVIMFGFAACSLFTDNLDLKYSATELVAYSGSSQTITVTKKELYDTYRQWGYQYAGQMSEEDLLSQLCEYILNNKILRQYSIQRFSPDKSAPYYPLYPEEQASVLQKSYDAINKTLREYVYDFLDLSENKEEESSETTADTRTVIATKKNGVAGSQDYEFTLNLVSYKQDAEILPIEDYVTESGRFIGYAPEVPGVAESDDKVNDKVIRQSLAKVVRNLQNMENGFNELENATDYLDLNNPYIKGLSKSDKYVLNREVKRLVEANTLSALVLRMSKSFELGIEDARGWVDYLRRGEDFEAWAEATNADWNEIQVEYESAVSGLAEKPTLDEWLTDVWVVEHKYYPGHARVIAEAQAGKVIDYYKSVLKNAVLDATIMPDNYTDSAVMSAGLSKLNYVPQKVIGNLFTVSHILLGFSDEQKTQYKNILATAEKDKTYDKESALQNLYSQVKVNDESVYQIYNKISAGMAEKSDLAGKYDLFREYVNEYNSDPGLADSNYEYLMTAYEYKDDGELKNNNSMIQPFTEASLKLYKAGEKGAISGLVWGDYGAHIVMYSRDVSEMVYTTSPNISTKTANALVDSNYAKTLFAPVSYSGSQTKFDTLMSSYTRSFSDYQTALLNEFKSQKQNKIYIVTSAFKDFI